MKKLLILLFSLFFLSSPSVFADDISDFQIEGMSIGDSLLDYMTEEEILKEIEITKNDYNYLEEPNKYVEVYLFKNLKKYETVSFFVNSDLADLYIAETDEKYTIPGIRESNQYITDKNEKYTIMSIRGLIDYTEDFDGCIQKRDEIVSELSKMFPNADKRSSGVFEYGGDPSGESIIDAVYFEFVSGGEIEISCYDYEETLRIKRNWSDLLNVAINTEEIISWLSDWY